MGSCTRFVIWLFVCLSLLFGSGFLLFCHHILHLKPSLPGREGAAIVVLTGGPHRLETGLMLLKTGKGERLLISGVNKDVKPNEILPDTRLPVDLDYSAQNTIQNAQETKSWVERHHFHSLILVTSRYHMPRAHLELSQRLGNVSLFPYPAEVPGKQVDKFLLTLAWSEYRKYTLALVRASARFVALKLRFV